MMITPGSFVYSRLIPFALFRQLTAQVLQLAPSPGIVHCQLPEKIYMTQVLYNFVFLFILTMMKI
jgi:hypothetical protein